MTSLNARLLAAHAARDTRALVSLYEQAAARTRNTTEGAFFLTHAYVFALEAGLPQVDSLHAKLAALGRI